MRFVAGDGSREQLRSPRGLWEADGLAGLAAPTSAPWGPGGVRAAAPLQLEGLVLPEAAAAAPRWLGQRPRVPSEMLTAPLRPQSWATGRPETIRGAAAGRWAPAAPSLPGGCGRARDPPSGAEGPSATCKRPVAQTAPYKPGCGQPPGASFPRGSQGGRWGTSWRESVAPAAHVSGGDSAAGSLSMLRAGAPASAPRPRCPEGSPRSPSSVRSEQAEPPLFGHRELDGT